MAKRKHHHSLALVMVAIAAFNFPLLKAADQMKIDGISMTVVHLFGTWVLIICLAFMISRPFGPD